MTRSLKTLIPLAILLALAVACDETTEPTVEALESFTITLPEEAVSGRPFTITATAAGDKGTSPLPEFGGPVDLESSAGTLSPSSIDLVGGSATGEFTLTGAVGGRPDLRDRFVRGTTPGEEPGSVFSSTMTHGHPLMSLLAVAR